MASAAAVATTVLAGSGYRVDDAVVLRAEQVTKVFPGTVVLDHVDFNVYRDKVNALIGENGVGKSTLMKIVAGVERPTVVGGCCWTASRFTCVRRYTPSTLASASSTRK